MVITHLASALNIAWKLLLDYGYDPKPIFSDIGIDPEIVKNPTTRIKYSLTIKLWRSINKKIKDPCIGVRASEFWHPSYMYALGYAWMASYSLREAFNRLLKYLRVTSEGVVVTVEESQEGFIVKSARKDAHDLEHIFNDGLLSIILKMCRINFGNELNPLVVKLSHSNTECSKKYKEYFKSDIVFDALENSLTFSTEDIDQPLLGSNPYLAELNDQVLIQYMEKLDGEDIVAKTKAKIIDMLPSGNITDEKVSKELFTSVRTFQRRIKEKGTSFKTILTETRKDLALQYLKNSDIRLEEIAFLMGFSEYSAFSKAFKRWTGYSPNEFRV